jgi:hypothetical protein
MSPNPGSRRTRIRAACTLLSVLATGAPPLLAEGWQLDTLVPGSPFRSLHGLAFGPDAKIYAGSVVGQSIHRVDPDTGASEVFIPPPPDWLTTSNSRPTAPCTGPVSHTGP